jgi:hypothetical protein
MLPQWYKTKRYPHIGLPLGKRDARPAIRKITDPDFVARYAFLPFIHRVQTTRKYRRVQDELGHRLKDRVAGKKERELYYAAPFDYNIFSYYASLINNRYESELSQLGLQDVVLAYRKVPHPEHKRNQCNIDFANTVFNTIRSSSEVELSVIALDISAFFDNLDHSILKGAWKKVFDFAGSLPADHYRVFKAITQFWSIREKRLFKRFKDQIIVRQKGGAMRRKPIAKMEYLRKEGAVAFCEEKEFLRASEKQFTDANRYRKDEDGKRHLRTYGIPQGSPISAILANLYLLDFDVAMESYVSSIDGRYWRYSDDILLLVPTLYEKDVVTQLDQLLDQSKLKVNHSKDQMYRFRTGLHGKECFEVRDGYEQKKGALQYLGFEFDGRYTRLRPQSLSSFYRKMKRSIRRGRYYANHIRNETRGKIFKGRLYKRFTVKGAERRRIYQRSKEDPAKFEKTARYDWGNFLTYALMADRIVTNSKIKSQIKKAWPNFHIYLRQIEESIRTRPRK